MKQLQGIYFYNGFYSPEKIADDIYDFMDNLRKKETTVTSNYLGDLSNDLLNDLYFIINESYVNGEDINNLLYDYSFFYHPTIEDFQQINVNRYGLDKNQYLKGLI